MLRRTGNCLTRDPDMHEVCRYSREHLGYSPSRIVSCFRVAGRYGLIDFERFYTGLTLRRLNLRPRNETSHTRS